MLKTVTNSINASQIQTPITLPGDVTLSTGNLVIGTSGKGIDFSATLGTGTSELLADYEEGTWTPIDASGASLSFTTANGVYTKVGRQVTCHYRVVYPSTVNVSGAIIGGLPFNIGSSNYTGFTGYNSGTGTVINHRVDGAASFFVSNAATGTTMTNAQMSTIQIQGTFIYTV
jgi:hypothetical protein